MNVFSNKEEFLRANEFMLDQIEQKGLGINISKSRLLEEALYINKQINVGGGTIPLITGKAVSEIGTTNFDGNKLEAGRLFCANTITFLAGEDANTADVCNVDYTEAPSTFNFANLVVRQKNEIVLKLPLIKVMRGQKSRVSNGSYKLDALAFLEAEHRVDVDLEFPVDIKHTPATGKVTFVSVVMGGFSTYLKR